MMNIIHFPKLPFTDPVIVFTLLISIILLAPIIFRKFKIPGLIGLIISGIIIGPHGLNLVAYGESIKLLSTAGLLYLMFLAGLELDMREFMRSRNKSLVFGLLTFFIPLIIGFTVSYYYLNFGISASLLVASMFSTHTLISYPIASRLGITKSESVIITIGGTIITDTAVLLLLAFISAATTGSLSLLFWLRMIFSISLFSFLILWGVPKLSTWFFKNMEGESGAQYVFILAVLFISSLLASMAGIEPIIGAFLAGLALSSLVPHSSALMNRISFIGNNLFIPIFLISVGLMVDLKVIANGSGAILFTTILVIVALLSKYLAAYFTQKIFSYSTIERNVIFGLSVSHAAAIIAVVIVGYDLKLIGLEILNGAILIILVSCLIGTFITEKAGKKLAVIEVGKISQSYVSSDRILVSVANPATIESLIDFAILIRSTKSTQPLYMLSVVPDDANAKNQIQKNSKMYESVISHAAAAEVKVSHVTRVDINIANGIARAAKELQIDKLILGWNGKSTTTNFFFGSIMDNLISSNDQMIIVTKCIAPINTINRVVVILPDNSESEYGFTEMIETILILAKHNNSSILLQAKKKSIANVKAQCEKVAGSSIIAYSVIESNNPITEVQKTTSANDLLVAVAARPHSLSYQSYLDHMPRDLAKYHEKTNFLIVYPEQHSNKSYTLSESLSGMDTQSVNDNNDRFINFSTTIRKSPGLDKHNPKTE